jgi:hypothetical protein|tara:strand:+ start:586 stop:822 length:237 start_codon:yes stop_codon:yes gene_type:complete
MADLMNSLFGPLDRKFCDWFFLLSLIGLILLVILLAGSVVALFKGKLNFMVMLPVALSYGIFYFQNRLLYNMCQTSLQ